MVYYEDNDICIRTIEKRDIQSLVDGFAEQNWNKPFEQFLDYYNQHLNNERTVIVCEKNGEASGYVTLLSCAKTGPFANQGIPEIVDFNVLIKYQKKGIGNKLMDVIEAIAKEKSDYVSLSVGLHYGYGTAQRMYVKRGYIPDGSGVWYNGKQLEQYAECVNDDDLTLYFLKKLA